jgi:hypothetical protein
MPGGLMNLVSYGQQNVILNGNPTKTFFKTSYAQYTNFGLQKFRVDFEGSRTLRLTEDSVFMFKIPRYADLLMDSYVSLELPHIWSPIYNNADVSMNIPYEFKWIENIGSKMVKKISITCGNQTLQEYSGDYLLASVQRDYSADKKDLFDKMTGHVKELYDPGHSGKRVGYYPSAIYTDDISGAEPSIRSRTLYIPLNSWFSLKTQMAFPLTSLQYNELHITITFRPINELFRIRDVKDASNNYPYVAPNFNNAYMQFHRFLQSPPSELVTDTTVFPDTRTLWNTDIHLNCTYCFLSNDEARLFALQEQKYLFRQVNEKRFTNVTGTNKIDLKSLGMICSNLFYLQRSDVNLRNEWSNYTNWDYNNLIPQDVEMITDSNNSVFFSTGISTPRNEKDILVQMAILLDGSYRENSQPVGVYNYIEKHTRTQGNAPDGLYCYNYCLNTNPYDIQPSGAINMNRFNQVEMEFVTIRPPYDENAQTKTFCDENGIIIGINKPTWVIYTYNYDLVFFEERLNVVTFVGGNCGLMYAT